MDKVGRGSLVGWAVTVALLLILMSAGLLLVWLAVGPGWSDSENPVSGTDFFRAISFVALVIGGFLYVVASASRAMSVALAVPPLPFVGIAAVFMATAYFYSYDEYAYPTLIRISEVSTVSDWWIGLLALGAIAAALVAWRRPRIGLLAEGAFLYLVAAWLFAVGPWR